MSYALGIDVGTTFTAVAIQRGDLVETLALGTGNRVTIPSVIFVEGGDLLFGSAAERRGAVRTDGIAREFKRRVGDPVAIMLSGSPYHASRLTALMTRDVLQRATDLCGEAPQHVTVAHPANWTSYQLTDLTDALAEVGLDSAGLISEPAAAALDYAAAARLAEGETILVYDLGGGTFDVAVLRRTTLGFEQVTDPTGIPRLGGIDFDQAVFEKVLESVPPTVLSEARTTSAGRAGLAHLRRMCVEAKEALSEDTAADVPVTLPNHDSIERITRPEFEAMITEMIDRTIGHIEGVLRRARMAPSDLNAVLLVGGSSRIPFVSARVFEQLDVKVRVDAHPKFPVARGAARHAAAGQPTSTRESTPIIPATPKRPRSPEPPVGELGARSVLSTRPPEPAVDPRWDRAEPPTEHAPDPVVDAPPEPTTVDRPEADRSRRRRAVTGATVAAVVIAAGVALVLTRREQPDDPADAIVPPLDATTTIAAVIPSADLALLAAGDGAAAAEQAVVLSIGNALGGDPAPTNRGTFGSATQVPDGTDAVIIGPGVALTTSDLDRLAANRTAVCAAVPGPELQPRPQHLDLGVRPEVRQASEAALRDDGLTAVPPGPADGLAADQVALVAGGSREVVELLVEQYGADVGDAARVYDCAATLIAAWWSAAGEFDALDLDASGTPCTRLLDCQRDPGSHWGGRDVEMIGIGAGDRRFACGTGGCEALS